MRNHSNKRFRGRTSLTTDGYGESRMYIETAKPTANRQCPACKHKFTVANKKKQDCPECGCNNTRTIA